MKCLVLPVLYCGLMRLFLRIIVGVRYYHREVLGKHDQFIIVANHNSHLDTMALMSACSPGIICRTHPVAAADYFGQSPVRSFFTRFFVNALLIPRKRPAEGEEGPDPIQMMIDQLDNGHSLIVFPEGTRGAPEQFKKFKRGVGIVLEKRPHIRYIPVYIKGLGRSLPKGEALLVPFNSMVVFGEARLCKANHADDIVAEIEMNIKGLAEEVNAAYGKKS